MTCREFEKTLPERVRRGPVEQEALAAAEEHERTCSRCAARAAAERELTAGLGMLRSAMPDAPRPEVEAALLARFRTERRRPAARRWVWAAAVAACLVAAISGWVNLRAGRPGVPAAAKQLPVAPAVVTQTVPPAALVPRVTENQAGRRPRKAAAVRAPAPLAAVAPRRKRSPRPAPATAAEPMPAEVSTEFFPVSWGAASTGYASLMRVKLPRNALASYGLPVNPDGASGWIQADVLVGEDGVARAIRFVQ
jgi:hypothetical protein